MPTRWLSIRKRNPLLLNDPDSQPPAKQQEFDFAFGEPPSVAQTDSSRVGPRLVQIRPTTSGGNTGKRKPRVELPSIRPRTSETHKPSPLQNLNGISKSEDSFIGLAFGSPSHPPASFTDHAEARNPVEHNSFAEGLRDKVNQMQSKRWRKFGTLFKPRHVLRRDEVPSGPTIGLPMGLVVLDKDSSIQLDNAGEDRARPGQPEQPKREPPPPPVEKGAKTGATAAGLPLHSQEDDLMSRPSTATATDAGSVGEPHSRPPIPKLELAIPRNLDAAKRSSSLLARRSKTLESLRSFEDSRPTTKGTMDGDLDGSSKPGSKPLTPLMPPRRLTTPTMTRSPAVSKYSLFPTTSPAPVKFVGRVPSSENDTLSTGQLKRSATSPARLSPMQDQFSGVSKPVPLYPKRVDSVDQIFNSPEDNTASTDREAPWSSAHSFQSSVSSATTVDEIFFDIKSFRDSKGMEDGHFVMTRPDSAQVELARTRSKRAPPSSRLRQMEASTSDEGPSEPAPASTGSQSAWTTKHTSVNTAYFDEAIAAVERLTTPTGDIPRLDMLPSIPTVTIADHDDRPPLPSSLSKLQPPKPADHHLRLTSKSHEEVSRLIPSPVVELKEDDSPRPDASPTAGAKTQQIPVAKLVSPRIAAVRRVDRPIDDSPTIPQGPPSPKRTPIPPSPSEDKPPPVPKKDAKFIPMSKFAPKGTVTAIEQRAGVTPTRPVRANTEDLVLRNPPQRVSKERSATMPSSVQPQPPHQSPQSSSLRGLEKTVPPRPNPVALNPVGSAEVAVARTISLSRKQSARVHIPGPRLAARRAEVQAQTQGQAQTLQPQIPAQQVQRQPSAHNRNPSAVSQKSNKSAKAAKGGILGHRHKRTASSAKSASRASKDFSSKTKVVKPQADGKSGSFGKLMWSKESEKKLIKEARKWEILEKKSYSPVVVQAERGHRPGLSVGLIVEST